MPDGFDEPKRNALDFIETDLGLVRTFYQLSEETDDPEIRTRNIHNAERAFQFAVKTFRDFSEQTEDWKKAKAELDAVDREDVHLDGGVPLRVLRMAG